MHGGLVPSAAAIIASSAAMVSLLGHLVRVAKTTDPVILVGETGTGKSTIARLLHELSGRPGRMAEVSAAELTASLASDQLFGHERGAFTGADRSRKGCSPKRGTGQFFSTSFIC